MPLMLRFVRLKKRICVTMISAVWLCGCVWMFISKRLVLDIGCVVRELGKMKWYVALGVGLNGSHSRLFCDG